MAAIGNSTPPSNPFFVRSPFRVGFDPLNSILLDCLKNGVHYTMSGRAGAGDMQTRSDWGVGVEKRGGVFK
jgi:hypothetical protein